MTSPALTEAEKAQIAIWFAFMRIDGRTFTDGRAAALAFMRDYIRRSRATYVSYPRVHRRLVLQEIARRGDELAGLTPTAPRNPATAPLIRPLPERKRPLFVPGA